MNRVQNKEDGYKKKKEEKLKGEERYIYIYILLTFLYIYIYTYAYTVEAQSPKAAGLVMSTSGGIPPNTNVFMSALVL
jgi:hypothetical protein